MNLVIDIGNTFIKLGVFQNNNLIDNVSLHKDDFQSEFEKIEKEYTIKAIIVCSVSVIPRELLKYKQIIFVNVKMALPFKVNYKTPYKLGQDRIALVAAASQIENTNVLIIDCGTCITADFINSEGYYIGGSISPGINMRLKSLNEFTKKLPLVDLKESTPPLTGNTTQGCILSGVVNGVINEIDGSVAMYKQQYPNIKVILTGGDSIFLFNKLKSLIFADFNFLLKGLNILLNLNK